VTTFMANCQTFGQETSSFCSHFKENVWTVKKF
jgi:hypothetical protein